MHPSSEMKSILHMKLAANEYALSDMREAADRWQFAVIYSFSTACLYFKMMNDYKMQINHC